MKIQNISHPDQKNQHNQIVGEIDLLLIVPLVLKNWYWFIIAVFCALLCARFYINHTMPVYRTSATILINETENKPIVDNSEILQGLGLPGGLRNLQNQIMIIKSRALTENTLKELPFEFDFYFKTLRNKLPIYPETPIRVLFENGSPLPTDTEFSFQYLGNDMYLLKSENPSFDFEKNANLGDAITLPEGTLRIECFNKEWLNINSGRNICFTIHSKATLINDYSRRLEVEQLSREGSILKISLQGTNRSKDMDFLNKHLEGFQSLSLDNKNTEAERRIQFIDNQLIGISDSLTTTENKLQNFRSSRRVMDISAQGQSIIGQLTLLENERARLRLESNYYDYLAEYLDKDQAGEIPIVPMTMGITDPVLTDMVQELAEIQGQLSTKGAGEMNPLQRNLEQRVRTIKNNLRETLNGLRRRNSLAISENQSQINRANSQAEALPVTERQLLGIERKFQLNNEIYTFLLQTRATLEMQKASNKADSDIIDPADERFSTLIKPNRSMIYLIGLFAGFFSPLLVIYFGFILNKKLKHDEISRITNIPVIGHIPHNSEKSNTIVLNSPNSFIAEAFRLLRSRVQFLTKETKSPVILVTSTMPGDGKTFTAINIASVYSLLGLKTILIGFDLRKPKIYQDFNLSNEKGVSTWLIGKDSLKDIIQLTSFENLSIISGGPIPPNPSELTSLAKTEELFKQLKEDFDFIIIDSSPIGIVSDTFHLASLADACLLIVRPGHTLRDPFENTLNDLSSSHLKGISLVINDISSDSKRYGYGEKYGYTNDKMASGNTSIPKRQKKDKNQFK